MLRHRLEWYTHLWAQWLKLGYTTEECDAFTLPYEPTILKGTI